VGSHFTPFFLGREAVAAPAIPSTLAVPSVSVALPRCLQHGAHLVGLGNTKSRLFIQDSCLDWSVGSVSAVWSVGSISAVFSSLCWEH